jgi:flagellar basal body rod protein FlgC
MKLHKTKIAAALACAAFVGLSFAAPASAATASDISSKLASYGLSSDVVQVLSTKFDLGEPWDSLDGTSLPVSENTVVTSDFTTTTATYADGSINITKIAAPQSKLSRAYLSGCKTTSGTGYVNYSNCLVIRDTVAFVMAFTADFSLYPGPNNDKIFSAYNPYYGACFGFCGTPTVVINQAVESATSPAKARLQMSYGTVPWSSSIVWLDLRVGSQTVNLVEG